MLHINSDRSINLVCRPSLGREIERYVKSWILRWFWKIKSSVSYHPVSRKTKRISTKKKLTVWSHCLSSEAICKISFICSVWPEYHSHFLQQLWEESAISHVNFHLKIDFLDLIPFLDCGNTLNKKQQNLGILFKKVGGEILWNIFHGLYI